MPYDDDDLMMMMMMMMMMVVDHASANYVWGINTSVMAGWSWVPPALVEACLQCFFAFFCICV